MEIFLDRRFRSMQGPMSGRESNILKEGRILVFRKAINLSDSFAAYLVCVIEVIPIRFHKFRISSQSHWIPKRTRSRHRPIEMIEPTLDWSVLFGIHSKMPLTRQGSLIPCSLENFCHRHLRSFDTITIDTTQESRSGRPTPGRVVELGEPQAIRCKSIQIRGLDFTTKAPQIREPHIIGEDHHNIRPFSGASPLRKENKENEKR